MCQGHISAFGARTQGASPRGELGSSHLKETPPTRTTGNGQVTPGKGTMVGGPSAGTHGRMNGKHNGVPPHSGISFTLKRKEILVQYGWTLGTLCSVK